MDAHTGNDNHGLNAHREKARESGVIPMIGKLHVDVMNQECYLINNVDVQIKLTRSSNSFALIAAGANPGYCIIITDASFFVWKAKPSSALTAAHVKLLDTGETSQVPNYSS